MDHPGQNFTQLDQGIGDFSTSTPTAFCGSHARNTQWRGFIWIVLIISLELLLVPFVQGQESQPNPIIVGADFDQASLLPDAQLIFDPDLKLTPNQVLAESGISVESDQINFGVVSEAVWLRTQLDLRSLQAPKIVYLALSNPEIGDVQVYLDGNLVSGIGQKQLFSTREYLIPKLIIPLYLSHETRSSPDETFISMLVRLESEGSLRSKIELLSDRSLLAQEHQSSLWQGAYYGLAFLICCYFLVFYGFVRERIYLWVTGSLVSLVLIQLNFDGLLFQYLYPNNPDWFFTGLYLPSLMGYATSLLFIIEFFYLKEKDKKSYQILMGHVYYGGVLLIAWLFLDNYTLLILVAPFMFSGAVTCVYVCLKYLASGNKSVVFYTIAIALAASGAMTYFSLYIGLLPTNSVFESILRTTSLAQMAFVSLSLFSRYEENQEELREAKDEMLNSLVRANKVKDEFLSVVSHELRTPMNGVEGALELLKGHELPKQAIEFLELASRSSKDMVAMINNILDFTELHEKVEIKLEKFDLAKDVEKLFLSMGGRYVTNAVSLEFSTDEGVAKIYEGDARLLFKVLRHVFSNAMKFTDEGKISVTMSVGGYNEETNSEWVTVRIKDTGTGIESDHLEDIFEEFRQEDASMVRKFQGLGLGLPIAKGLMKVLRGNLEIESSLGEGTEVTLQLPLCVIQRVEQRAHERCNKKVGLDMLVVEDNMVNRKILVALLEKLGHTLSTAENGAIAVELAKQHQFDFIWMDCQMPVMDGIEATRHIRELESYGETPIVAVTANAFTQDEERCLAAGMSDFLAKPVNKNAIERVVSKWG